VENPNWRSGGDCGKLAGFSEVSLHVTLNFIKPTSQSIAIAAQSQIHGIGSVFFFVELTPYCDNRAVRGAGYESVVTPVR
jgi:hypothetical protein